MVKHRDERGNSFVSVLFYVVASHMYECAACSKILGSVKHALACQACEERAGTHA
jgi:hypothetical protein